MGAVFIHTLDIFAIIDYTVSEEMIIMTDRTNLELNNRYSWEEIVKSYPDMWAFLTDANIDETGRIKDAVLAAVCRYEEIGSVLDDVTKIYDKFILRRTTASYPMVGILC